MVSRSRTHVCFALFVGVVAGIMAFAGTAAAAGPRAITATQAAVGQFQLPPQSTDSGVAVSQVDCPSGTTVTGGGGVFVTGSALTTNTSLFESGPAPNGWYVRFDNDQAVPQAVSNNAICLNNKLKVKGGAKAGAASGGAQAAAGKPKAVVNVQPVTQQVQLPPQATDNGVAEFTVNCPTGSTVVGGGAIDALGTPLTTRINLFESGPVGNGWHVRWNSDSTQNQGASLTALCMKAQLNVKGSVAGLKKPKARTSIEQLSQSVQLPAQQTNAGVVESNLACPSGSTLVGGGARFGPNIPLNTNIELFESGPVGNGWHTRWNNNTASVQQTSIHVECIKNKLKIK